MSVPIPREEIERFRDIVSDRLGLAFDESRLNELTAVLRNRSLALSCPSAATYIDRVFSSADASDELRAIAQSLTVAETYFFRHPDHFRALIEAILPERRRAQPSSRKLQILSAGCSTGEEPYTVAMLIREHFQSVDVEIRGIDINVASLQRAKQARYTEWSLRETPDTFRQRFFRQEGRDFVLDASIQAMVRLEERNLMREDPSFWRTSAFDVIFCRNVTMYFTPRAMRDAIARMASALAPGGFLVLGPAETLRGISQMFHLRHTHDVFYYQLKTANELSELPVPPKAPIGSQQAATVIPPISEIAADASWLDAIFKASERIAALAQRGTAVRASTPAIPRPVTPPPYDLGHATELFRQEKFREAVGVLRSLPLDAETDTDAQLLLAVALAQSGDATDSEQVCRRVLVLDELNAGAHYVMALCREHAGDRRGAWEQDQVATYLDETFAMPHLHMGRLANALGQLDTSRREFEQALVLLAREDASRILLFGGGFRREALIQLCRRELQRKGDVTA